MDLRNIFDKTEVLLVLAIILGLIIGLKARISIDIPLGIVMFFSIRPFFRHKFDFKKKYKFIILSVLLNYVLLSGVYVLLSSIFFGQINFYLIGFLIVACVPPAIAIVPFCYLTKCDPETADASLFSAFVLGIFLMPLSLFLLFGENIDMLLLLRVMLIIIIIPGIFAYLLRDRKSKVFNYTKSITNICLALVLFIAVSVNREVFFTLNRNVLLSYFISFFSSQSIVIEKKGPWEGIVSSYGFIKRNLGELRKYISKNLKINPVPFLDVEIDEGEKNRQKIDDLLKN